MSLFVSSDISVLSVHEDGYARSGAVKPRAMPLFSSAIDGDFSGNALWSAEKPQARLVGWQEYLGTLLGKGSLYAAAVVIGCIGVVLLAYTIYHVIHDTVVSHGQINTVLFLLSESITLSVIGVAAIWFAKATFAATKNLAPVAPITRHNTGELSEFETLVRSSSVLSAQEQAELLRAAGYGSEIPANELLRAMAPDHQGG